MECETHVSEGLETCLKKKKSKKASATVKHFSLAHVYIEKQWKKEHIGMGKYFLRFLSELSLDS